MENHKELTLSDLRMYIIRYGAKYMEALESDLYYDCKDVENLEDGDSVFWMVSDFHTYIYSAKQMSKVGVDGVDGVVGNRFNYRIDCSVGKFGKKEYSMKRVWKSDIADAVNKEE